MQQFAREELQEPAPGCPRPQECRNLRARAVSGWAAGESEVCRAQGPRTWVPSFVDQRRAFGNCKSLSR